MRYYLTIIFFLYAFAAGILTGCVHTAGNQKIKGKVIDESTKTGIPGKTVIIQAVRNLNGKPITTEIAVFSTDSSGSFNYKFKKLKECRRYNFCLAGDSDYIFTTHSMSLFEIEKNADYLFFSISKMANLTINLYRKSIKPSSDTIRLIWQSDGVYGGSLYPYKIFNHERGEYAIGQNPALDLIWIGGKVNSTINTKVFAEKKTELTWELYRYGRRTIFVDTIRCKRDFSNVVNFSY
jgi:hypothetical protein